MTDSHATDTAFDDQGVFDARLAEAAAASQYKPYPFIAMDGTRHELPHPLMLDAEQQSAIAEIERDPTRDNRDFLSTYYPEQWAAISAMRPAVQIALMQGWNSTVNDLGGDDDMGKSRSGSSATKKARRR